MKETLYKLARGKSGALWVWEPGTNNIFRDDEMGGGFNNATVCVKLVDGNRITMVGPWMSNPEAMLKDTGVDSRER